VRLCQSVTVGVHSVFLRVVTFVRILCLLSVLPPASQVAFPFNRQLDKSIRVHS
jgi:hypothetical protein